MHGRVSAERGPDPQWWRSAVVYQIYPRSFADADGDGIGDIAGITDRLPYLARLGVDAVWVSPWYPSPMKDAGYDVADFRDIEPVFGTLATAEAFIGAAHDVGLRVLLDIVPNHSSDRHAWFQAALASPPGSPEPDRYLFRDGRGPDGSEPPNDWTSAFGGPAWTRVTEADGRPGQWYLRIFTEGQPDFNWQNPEVLADFERTLRFWFDRGVDGFRIDVAEGLVKDPAYPDVADLPWPLPLDSPADLEHPFLDRLGVHDIYRSWRRIGESYDPPRVFVAEAWVGNPEKLARYVRSDELHTAFNFDYLVTPWLAGPLRVTIDATLAAHTEIGAPPTWVLSNHDVPREVSRFARPQREGAGRLWLSDLLEEPADFAVGRRRARAAALLTLALPGGAYVYQGEELGLPEAEALPRDALQDPLYLQTDGESLGRDGCRVPLPWSGDRPPFGFSPGGATAPPWLPQPEDWAALTVAAQDGQEGSTFELYRAALDLRREAAALGDGTLRWLPADQDVLRFARDPGFECLVNLGSRPVPLPAGARILLASDARGPDGGLPPDTAVWLSTES
jgi:alpha-glucosidase